MNYNKKLDELFERWTENLSAEQKALFCKDGLILKAGEPESSVEEKWEKAKRRIMFIVKDKNTPDGDDIRRWLIEGKHAENSRNLSGGIVGKRGFLPNIARILYGLLKDQRDIRIGFKEVSETKFEEVREIWNTEPFALIEAKKLAGHPTVSTSEIVHALNQDKELLKEEMDILQPNIIVCCDPKGTQFNYITQYYLGKEDHGSIKKIEYIYPEDKMSCCLWYYPTKGITVIKSYHPTRKGKADWRTYERVISPFHNLLQTTDI